MISQFLYYVHVPSFRINRADHVSCYGVYQPDRRRAISTATSPHSIHMHEVSLYPMEVLEVAASHSTRVPRTLFFPVASPSFGCSVVLEQSSLSLYISYCQGYLPEGAIRRTGTATNKGQHPTCIASRENIHDRAGVANSI